MTNPYQPPPTTAPRDEGDIVADFHGRVAAAIASIPLIKVDDVGARGGKYTKREKLAAAILPAFIAKGLWLEMSASKIYQAGDLTFIPIELRINDSRSTFSRTIHLQMPFKPDSRMDDLQKMGALMTYSARYLFSVGLCQPNGFKLEMLDGKEADDYDDEPAAPPKPTAKNAPAQTAAARPAAWNAKIEKCTAYLRRLGTKRPIAPTTKSDAEIMAICAGALAADPIGESDSIKAFRSIDARISWATFYAECESLGALQAKLVGELIGLGAPEAVE